MPGSQEMRKMDSWMLHFRPLQMGPEKTSHKRNVPRLNSICQYIFTMLLCCWFLISELMDWERLRSLNATCKKRFSRVLLVGKKLIKSKEA
ncbi:hypothetical protein CEXT_386771 [Caerostris extrusa]|uniref:Uncharacterized protein n=1 Tax=Caerostris extrusa TaxID=172846 RepID=A0AAV4NM97_CAEEX|nr:hypothetical protein CEXT_386771 [Caerostris extrusa]